MSSRPTTRDEVPSSPAVVSSSGRRFVVVAIDSSPFALNVDAIGLMLFPVTFQLFFLPSQLIV